MSEHSKYGPGSYAAVRAACALTSATVALPVFEREALKRSTIMIDAEDNTLLRCALDGHIRTLQQSKSHDPEAELRRLIYLKRAVDLFNRLS